MVFTLPDNSHIFQYLRPPPHLKSAIYSIFSSGEFRIYEVMVVGDVNHVRETKEWLVFEFTKTRGPDVLNVRLKKANAPDLTLEEIESHEGQMRRFRGIVDYYWARSYNRVFLEIDSLEAVSEE